MPDALADRLQPASRLFPFALIPAAGRSRRMGVPKLLLDLGGQTVIARLLAALERAGVVNRLVVIGPEDAELRAEIARSGGRAIVAATPPPEMLMSIKLGLWAVTDDLSTNREAAVPDAAWLLIPADHPVIDVETIQRLLEAAVENPGRIIVPTYNGRRGHPTVFAWKHATDIDRVPPGLGFNWIVKQHAADVLEIAVPSSGVLVDLDTPEDYERLRALWQHE